MIGSGLTWLFQQHRLHRWRLKDLKAGLRKALYAPNQVCYDKPRKDLHELSGGVEIDERSTIDALAKENDATAFAHREHSL